MASEDTGTPSDLAGLLVVNPEPGNDGAPPAGASDASPEPKGEGEDRAEPDWDNAPSDDNAEADADATGGEDNPDEDGGAEAETGEDQPEEPLVEVTINGEKKKVTLKEAIDGYQRQADYTRKTEEVAREREALSAELAAVREHRASYKQVLDGLEARLLPANQEPTSEQWENLKAQDPGEYATQWADYQRRQEQRNAITIERHKLADQERSEQVKAVQAHVAGEREKLFAAMPHWKGQDGKVDPAKVDTEIKAIREYAAKNFGYSEQELNNAYDHRAILSMRKAMLYDKGETARAAAQKKLREAPEAPVRGSRVKQPTPSEQRRKDAQKQFEKSGRVDDAVELLLS